ncbi:MAG: HAD family hydrolase [Bacteroidota bacterium]
MDKTKSHILHPFSCLLLDMNSTFMFGEDRFGPQYDYAATYKQFGGSLQPEQVNAFITATYEHLDGLYPDPAFHDTFPTVAAVLRGLADEHELSPAEVYRLERTFATHELGRIPEPYADGLQRLASSHRLALVADIWAQKAPWLDELGRAGVLDLFETTIFSSEIGSVKPSPRGFALAVEELAVHPRECVVIGDSIRRDVGGAKAAGLSSILIGGGGESTGADYVVEDLLELVA